MKLPQLPAPPQLESPFPATLYVKPPDPLGEYKKTFGLLGRPFGVWGGRRQQRYDPMSVRNRRGT